MAGGGLKGGIAHGATDALGFHAIEDRHYVTDIHATVLHQLGIDPRRLEIPAASAWPSTSASRSARSSRDAEWPEDWRRETGGRVETHCSAFIRPARSCSSSIFNSQAVVT